LLPSRVWSKLSVINELAYLKEPIWKSASLLFLVAFSLYLNAFQFIPYELNFFEKCRPLVNLIRIDQRWGMFAPIVFRDDGWFIFEGKTNCGEIDIYNEGKQVNFEKPDLVVSRVKNDRWRKYQENILFVHNSHLRPYYCNWLLREWNKNAQDSLKISSVNIIYMKEFTMANYMTIPVSKELLCSCSN
ncbi:MAG: hypothetical protein H7329_14245, partial [Opitutaceae bacterium]|nr:hypothetical protein [Cytophagales bacterium]